jgi:hypothetical protein
MIQWVFIVIMFLLGLYVILNYGTHQMTEAFTTRCPDVLVQEGEELILKNTKLAEIPGVNPVRFKNLEDYVEFLEWQHSQNINCPVHFYKKTFDSQNNAVYQEHPAPEVSGTRPASTREVSGTRPTLDQEKMNELRRDPLIVQRTPDPLLNNYVASDAKGVSDNAMDYNWGGVEHEQRSVDEGKYKGSEVTKYNGVKP